MGKGSNPRPRFISNDEWRKNFERIFGHDEDFSDTEPEQVGQPPVQEGDETENQTAD